MSALWVVMAGSFAAMGTRAWMDGTQPIETRVEALLGEMSLQEKVDQLLHVWVTVNDGVIKQNYGKTGLGAAYLQQISSNSSCNVDPLCRLRARNSLQQYLVNNSRLGIPMMFVTETLHTNFEGLRTTGSAVPMGTNFPMPVTQGASWNTTLVQSVAESIALETRSSGSHQGFSPEVQVCTDPRFGRMIENFGSDPLLVSRYATAAVHGATGTPSEGNTGPDSYIGEGKIITEAKHFAAYGYGGHDGAPADVSIPALYDIYLKPWKAFVKAGGRGCMAAHNSVNGQPCHSSSWLLTNIFRNELGCEKCLIGSDFDDILNLNNFGTASPSKYPGQSTYTDASIQTVTAGLDMDLGGVSYPSLLQAVQKNQVNVSYVDRAVGNVLRAKFAAGLFDSPIAPESALSNVHSQKHVETAKEASLQGMVLLQNPGRILPLSPSAGLTVALLGPNAGCVDVNSTMCDVSQNMVGGYSAPVVPGQVKTVLDALKTEPGVQTKYIRGVEIDSQDTSGIPAAASLAASSDVAVVVLGDSGYTVGEARDRVELDLTGKQLDLLEAVLKTGKKTVVVLINGRVATFGEGANSRFGSRNSMLTAPNLAVVEAWTPGEQGGPAIVDILFGRRQPGGRLAQPFPAGVGLVHSWSVPWFHQRQGDYGAGPFEQPWALVGGSYAPLFCFGHGLSYSNYTISNMRVSSSSLSPSSRFTVTVDVTEVQPYVTPSGTFTLQIYFSQSTASRQVRDRLNLLGFGKEHIVSSGSPTSFIVSLDADDLGYTVWNPTDNTHPYGVEKGSYVLYACYSSCHCPLNLTVTVG
eukprot:TRINITY_DN3014_c9_g1_i1.p1 TRINITY_DN3014_c9_g1~~TRINITY_DN3014_c9_g1_i1.p1  ORF type:complete len:825 (+),score=158.14 TRINITY_DN3014_c9_g1_i1:60-2477(+)